MDSFEPSFEPDLPDPMPTPTPTPAPEPDFTPDPVTTPDPATETFDASEPDPATYDNSPLDGTTYDPEQSAAFDDQQAEQALVDQQQQQMQDQQQAEQQIQDQQLQDQMQAQQAQDQQLQDQIRQQQMQADQQQADQLQDQQQAAQQQADQQQAAQMQADQQQAEELQDQQQDATAEDQESAKRRFAHQQYATQLAPDELVNRMPQPDDFLDEDEHLLQQAPQQPVEDGGDNDAQLGAPMPQGDEPMQPTGDQPIQPTGDQPVQTTVTQLQQQLDADAGLQDQLRAQLEGQLPADSQPHEQVQAQLQDQPQAQQVHAEKQQEQPADDSTSRPKKPQAEIGDIKQYNRQGRAIWEDGERVSEHEHIGARVNWRLQTTDPDTDTSPYDDRAYRQSVTLTIPEDMARVKTELDMDIRDALKQSGDTGTSDALVEDSRPIESDIQRTIAARDEAIRLRQQAGEPIDDLLKITDEKIIEAAHLQGSTLHEVGKTQAYPDIDGTDVEDWEKAFDEATTQSGDQSYPSGDKPISEGPSSTEGGR